MKTALRLVWIALSCLALSSSLSAADLVLVNGKQSDAVILVAADAGTWEKRAATDLAAFIEKIAGAKLPVVDTAPEIAERLKQPGPQLIVGQLALTTNPALKDALAKVAKKNPVLRADAIVVRRAGNRVYLAGTNDDSHYYAVVTLLNHWGCRWYLPTDLGESIPKLNPLQLGKIDTAYGSPFEVRRYWISWNGNTEGKDEFMHRNFFNELLVPNGHNLAQYTKDLIPPGKTMFNVPIADDTTADHVAKQVAPLFAAGKDVQLGMEDGLYRSDSPLDKELMALQYDKYFMMPSATDAFMTFYNKVAERLLKAHPNSKSHIGFLAYANITLPPVKVLKAAKPLVAYLAPIDIDPIHDMDSPLSAPKREYKAMLYKWAKIMDGRVVIYDYDQGMMVWRDIPAPSVQMFRKDVQHYQKAGILGIDTESRGAFATTFTNLFYRGQLLWNPQVDVDKLEADFYANFYGPAAAPMQAYWQAIVKAWSESIVTEHEYHVIPAIYTSALVEQVTKDLTAAATALNNSPPSPNKDIFARRLKATQLAHGILQGYVEMIRESNTNCDYAKAVVSGERALQMREELTALHGMFTTYKNIGEHGAAWWPGEVEQYRKLAKLTNGELGTLVLKTPAAWHFRADPKDIGAKNNWATTPPSPSKSENLLPPWREVQSRQHDWQSLRTDLYIQAQGVVSEDHQGYTGHGWYQVTINIPADQVGQKLHLMFPGLFNESWLYVNGEQVAHREKYNPIWWYNAYEFEWDIDLAGKLKAGDNIIALRIFNPHHMGGMFRRPFVYAAK